MLYRYKQHEVQITPRIQLPATPALIFSLYSWQCNKAIQHTAKVFCDTLSSPANFWKAVGEKGGFTSWYPDTAELLSEKRASSQWSYQVEPWFQSYCFIVSFSRLSDDLLSKWGNLDQMLSFNKTTDEAAAPLLLSLYLGQLNIRMKKLLSLCTVTFILSFLCCKFLSQEILLSICLLFWPSHISELKVMLWIYNLSSSTAKTFNSPLWYDLAHSYHGFYLISLTPVIKFLFLLLPQSSCLSISVNTLYHPSLWETFRLCVVAGCSALLILSLVTAFRQHLELAT